MPPETFLQHLERAERHKKALWETRKAAIKYHQQGKDPAWIAPRLGVQARTVQEWIHRYEAGGMESLRPYQRVAQVSPQPSQPALEHPSPAAQEEPQPVRHSLLSRRLAFIRQLLLEPR